MRILNIANGNRIPSVWTEEFVTALSGLGELTLAENGHALTEEDYAAQARAHDAVIVGWDARPLPALLADDTGTLRYICSYSGTIRMHVPKEILAAGVMVSNWGDHPANGVAEAAMTLLLAVLKEIPKSIDVVRAQKWGVSETRRGTLAGTRVGIYGCGVIGRRFVELLRPFGAEIRVYDPYAEAIPEGCERAGTLEALAAGSEVLVIHAGLSEETTGSVRAEHFALLPDGGVVINTARGAILDEQALFAELSTGRLRAGLDVLERDYLEPDHPMLGLDNCLLTFHQLDKLEWPPRPGLTPMQQICFDNLARFARGEEPTWLFDSNRYDRST